MASESLRINIVKVDAYIQELQMQSNEMSAIISNMEGIYGRLSAMDDYETIRQTFKNVINQAKKEYALFGELEETINSIKIMYQNSEECVVEQYESFGGEENRYPSTLNGDAYVATDKNTLKNEQEIGTIEEILDYLKRSVKQLIFGNFSDEVTLLGTLGQIITGLVGVDLPGDIRDLVADITKLVNGKEVKPLQIVMDIIALIPLIGALKYTDEVAEVVEGGVKYADEIAEVIEGGAKYADEVVEGIESGAKYTDEVAEGIESGVKHADEVSDSAKVAEDVADQGKSLDEVVESGNKTGKLFKNQSLLEEHYGKHGQEIVDVLGKPNYSIDKYLDDANYIINNGTYVPELNGYVSFMSGKKYGFVGIDRTTGDITTFHIKNVSELIKKAPSLGVER